MKIKGERFLISLVKNFGLKLRVNQPNRQHSQVVYRVKSRWDRWLVVLGFNATLTAKVILWRSVTHYVFPGFLTPVLTQLFFPKPPTTFLTCFCRGERRKYAGRKVASTGDQTHNHQVMSPTRSPLSHPGGAQAGSSKDNEIKQEKYKHKFQQLWL